MTKEKVKKIVSYIIPPLITVGLCYVLYADMDMAQLWQGIRSCNPLLVALFLSCNVIAMILRGVRWRLQLRAIGASPGLGVMSRSIFGTYAVNIVFPRLGEIWRTGFISRIAGKPFSEVFGTMVADRLSDTITVLLVCIPTFILTSGALNSFLQAAGLESIGSMLTSKVMIVTYVLIAVFALFVWKGRGRFADKLRNFLRNTWNGFIVILHMPHKATWLLLTIGIWGSYILSMYLSMLAFPSTAMLLAQNGFGAALITFVFGSLAMAIPSNGGIGPWQFAIMLCLGSLYGFDKDQALTFATLNLAATTLLTILLGIYSFIHIAVKKS